MSRAPQRARAVPFRPIDELRFVLCNRIPRRLANRFMGWFSRLEIGWLARLSIAVWRRCDRELDLDEAATTRFASLRDAFVRPLRPGARPIDPDPAVLTCPCDTIVGACGEVREGQVIQAKGLPYSLLDLLQDPELVARHSHGSFVTLRIKAGMYHRFHAPCDGRLGEVVHIAGDSFNVDPIALARVERLFCRNERAVLDLDTGVPGESLTLVPIAAILVGGLRVHGLPELLDMGYRGPRRLALDARFAKGDELGWFEHGSTIVAFASGDLELCPGVRSGQRLRVGEPLFRRVGPAPAQGASAARPTPTASPPTASPPTRDRDR